MPSLRIPRPLRAYIGLYLSTSVATYPYGLYFPFPSEDSWVAAEDILDQTLIAAVNDRPIPAPAPKRRLPR